jgi:hypothetical protein
LGQPFGLRQPRAVAASLGNPVQATLRIPGDKRLREGCQALPQRARTQPLFRFAVVVARWPALPCMRTDVEGARARR